jgi:hypothetical protein
MTTRAWTRCRRTLASTGKPCNRQLREHPPEGRACPDGNGETFLKHKQPRTQASQSFTQAEVEAMTFMVRGLAEGKDLRIFARHQAPVLGAVARKIATMRESINRRASAAGEENDCGDQKERRA